eukprot:m.255360 g.255360  ORF g.255360 m.255360 type:complete len:103 (+) comp40395_c1_seq5:1385-1693(+)
MAQFIISFFFLLLKASKYFCIIFPSRACGVRPVWSIIRPCGWFGVRGGARGGFLTMIDCGFLIKCCSFELLFYQFRNCRSVFTVTVSIRLQISKETIVCGIV